MVRLQWEQPEAGSQAGNDWNMDKGTWSLNRKDKSGMKGMATTGDIICKVISCFGLHQIRPVNKQIRSDIWN